MEKPLNILMLEDSATDAEIIQRTLLKINGHCTFKLVMNKEDYLEALDGFHPDLILSDNTLPQFNATEALEIFVQRSLHIPFILVTGTVSEEFAAGIMKLGADDYILKDRLIRLPAAIDAALQKKKAEAAIRHSEDVRKQIMNAALDAIICIDTSGTITVWNQQAEKMFGWEAEEIMGKELVEIIIPYPYREAHKKGFSHYLQTGEGPVLNKVLEMTALNRAGHEFPIELAIVSVKQTGGDFFCAFIRDITERKKAADKIKFNADLLNAVGQAVIATDLQGTVIYWNSAAEKIYGWPAAEAMGKSIVELTPVQESKALEADILEELEKGNFWSGEFLVQRRNGGSFPAFVTYSPIYDKQGKLTGIIGVSVDISERKKAAEDLKLMEQQIMEQRIQEQKKIARAIIRAQEKERNHIGQELHDSVNQTLASTRIYLGIVVKKNESIRESLKYPMELVDNSIEEIRQFSRKVVTPLKNIDLEELVRQILYDMPIQSTVANKELIYLVPKELLSDDLKLNIYRIIQEQINNILKHAEARCINISIKERNQTVYINIADDGKGFDVNAKRKGIGVSNMINRVESYNGKATIKSSLGNGCEIDIAIPLNT